MSVMCSLEKHVELFAQWLLFYFCLLIDSGALDIIRAHDGIIKQKKAYRDVFLPDAIMLRDRQV